MIPNSLSLYIKFVAFENLTKDKFILNVMHNFHNPDFLQKCLIFSWFSIFHNRIEVESQNQRVEIWA